MAEQKLEVSTFTSSTVSRRMPITAARQRTLQSTIGNVFKVVGGYTEFVESRNDNGESKKVPRAVYDCQTLNSGYLPLGTQLTVKIKGVGSVLNNEQNQALLLGSGVMVVAFDDLNQWSIPSSGMEGLSASGMRVLNISLEQALQVKVPNER